MKIYQRKERIMSLHLKIVVGQLILRNMSETILKRTAMEDLMKTSIIAKVAKLKSIQNDTNKTLEDYHQCYIEWDDIVHRYEIHCADTQALSVTKNQLQYYIEELAIQYITIL